MKAVVLGVSGFLGSNLASELLRRKVKVIGFGLKDSRNHVLTEHGIEMIEGDMLDLATLKIPFDGVDWVIHYASTTSPTESMLEPKKDSMNLTASRIIFEDAIKRSVKKIVFSSSGGTVYGDSPRVPVKETDPVHSLIPYTKTKLAVEAELIRMCQNTSTVPVVLRYANPYGPNQYPAKGTGVITAWLEALRDDKPIVVYGDGESARDYVYISDAVNATVAALESPNARGTYNVGTGTPTSLNELLQMVEAVTQRKLSVSRTMQRPSDVVKTIALDSTKAFAELGWKPTTSLRDGIAKTWEWVQKGEPFVIG